MIENFYTTSITVFRQAFVNNKSSLSQQGTFKGHIQQGTEDRLQEHLGFRFTKAFTIWCPPDTDVKKGDRLVQGENNYDVRFTEDRDVGENGHKVVIAEKVEVTGS